jgi:hypothetical protein
MTQQIWAHQYERNIVRYPDRNTQDDIDQLHHHRIAKNRGNCASMSLSSKYGRPRLQAESDGSID